ncbi:hypothetical protein TrVE_jg2946 [Triparma verrucosa]|uniref:Kinesin-like protein n=1 Tax=Triparma verrucosa TaxID=1606542 RepID=A0A9W7FL74_9STRA|nr:hypothetical protein TrVE_jg2946 [Triparma verrucosa]
MKDSIKVCIRLRPPSAMEQANGDEVVVHQLRENTLSVTTGEGKPNLECAYGAVLGSECGQEDVFKAVVGTVEGVADGINGCIFTYGQTGAGKTYTMLGSGVGKHDGVTARSVKMLFEHLKKNSAASAEGGDEARFSVHCSFLQIYNERLHDLLAGGGEGNSSGLNIREHKNRRSGKPEVFVSGLSEYRVTSLDDVLTLIDAGSKSRALRSTDMNDVSSRSHAVLQLSVEAESVGEDFSVLKRAKLNLVDLAGSEKMNTKANITRGHKNELTNINSSLSTLGNVMAALGDKSRTHVPYRDSKLTRLLQDSLGGNTKTTVICCVSPCSSAVDETTSTLKFADRARRVMLHVRTNEVVDDKILLARAQSEIARLRTLLKMYMGQSGRGVGGGIDVAGSPTKIPVGGGGVGAAGLAVEDLVQENARLMEQNRMLKMALKREGVNGNNIGGDAAGGQPSNQSTYRTKKRLPNVGSKVGGMNDIYSTKVPGAFSSATKKKNGKGGVGGGQQQQQSDSENEGDLAQLRRDLAGKRKKVKKGRGGGGGKGDKLGVELMKVSEEHSGAVEEHDRIRQEREELERQLAKMMAAQEEEENEGSAFENDGDEGDEDYGSDEDFEDDDGEEKKQNDNLGSGKKNKKIVLTTIDLSSSKVGGGGAAGQAAVKISPVVRSPSPIVVKEILRENMNLVQQQQQQQQKQQQALVLNGPPSGGKKGTAPRRRMRQKKAAKEAKDSVPIGASQIKDSTLQNNKSVEDLAVNLTFSMADLGSRIAVYSFRYDAYYASTIVGFDHRRGMHCVLYDDGGESGIDGRQWYDLSTKKIRKVVEVVADLTGGRGKKRRGKKKKGAGGGDMKSQTANDGGAIKSGLGGVDSRMVATAKII